MPFQYLHFLHLPCINILAGLCIAVAQQIHSLNIEFVDKLSLVFDSTVTVHCQPGYLSDDIGNDAVLLVAEGTDEKV